MFTILFATLLHLEKFQGTAIEPHNEEIISIVNRVFYDYPYRYDGKSEGYTESIKEHAKSANGYVVLAMDGEKVVGVATGIPLSESGVTLPGVDPSSVYYLCELLLLPEYRGQGLGTKMGREIEHFAKEHGYTLLALTSMEAPGYTSAHTAFKKLGYTKHPDKYYETSWVHVGETEPTSHRLFFWTRPITPLHFENYQGKEAAPHNETLISFVNRVLYDYPYRDSEGYTDSLGGLRGYAQCPDRYVLFAKDGEKVVGVATGIPLADSWDSHTAPLKKKMADVSKVYYVPELMVLPGYQGQGLGTKLGNAIEQFAKEHGYTHLALMAIDSEGSSIFKRLSYTKHPEIFLDATWVHVGETEPTSHRLFFWTKCIPSS